jgi:hypothetical protein
MEAATWQRAHDTYKRLAERESPEQAAKLRAMAASFELAQARQGQRPVVVSR